MFYDQKIEDEIRNAISKHAKTYADEELIVKIKLSLPNKTIIRELLTENTKFQEEDLEMIVKEITEIYYGNLSLPLILEIEEFLENWTDNDHLQKLKESKQRFKNEIDLFNNSGLCSSYLFYIFKRDRLILKSYFNHIKLYFGFRNEIIESSYSTKQPSILNSLIFKENYQNSSRTSFSQFIENDQFGYEEKPVENTEILIEKYENEYPSYYSKYLNMKSLNVIQLSCLKCIENNNDNILLSAPTSSGKTLVAIIAIIKCIENIDHPKIFFTVPIKSLAHEKTSELKSIFNNESINNKIAYLSSNNQHQHKRDIKIIEVTTDVETTYKDILNSNICIGTPEKLDILTRKGVKFDLIILDEIHMLYDERGDVIEAIVCRTNTRIIAMSATIPNIEDVRVFLRVPAENCFIFDEKYRPNKLEFKSEQIEIKSESNMFIAQKAIRETKPLILFVNERKETLHMAELIANCISVDKSKVFDQKGSKIIDICWKESLYAKEIIADISDHRLVKLIDKGISIHHAGLNSRQRAAIERLFRDGYLNILVCTTTLCWGLNLDCSTVVIYGRFSKLEVIQMAGRAGRSSYNDGNIYKAYHYGSYDDSKYELGSKLIENLEFHLIAEIGLGNIKCFSDAFEWFKKTFYFQRLKSDQIKVKFIESASNDEFQMQNCEFNEKDQLFNSYNSLIYSSFINLTTHGFIKSFDLTILGNISFKYYLKIKDILEIVKINPLYSESSILELISNIIDCPEAELPNIDCPFPTNSKVYKIIQFISAGYIFTFVVKTFLQNIIRIVAGIYDYCLYKRYSVATSVLNIYNEFEYLYDGIECKTSAYGKICENKTLYDIKFDSLKQNCIFDPFSRLISPIKIKIESEALKFCDHILLKLDFRIENNSPGEFQLFVVDSIENNILHFHKINIKTFYSHETCIEMANERFINILLFKNGCLGYVKESVIIKDIDDMNICKKNKTLVLPNSLAHHDIIISQTPSKYHKTITFDEFNMLFQKKTDFHEENSNLTNKKVLFNDISSVYFSSAARMAVYNCLSNDVQGFYSTSQFFNILNSKLEMYSSKYYFNQDEENKDSIKYLTHRLLHFYARNTKQVIMYDLGDNFQIKIKSNLVEYIGKNFEKEMVVFSTLEEYNSAKIFANEQEINLAVHIYKTKLDLEKLFDIISKSIKVILYTNEFDHLKTFINLIQSHEQNFCKKISVADLVGLSFMSSDSKMKLKLNIGDYKDLEKYKDILEEYECDYNDLMDINNRIIEGMGIKKVIALLDFISELSSFRNLKIGQGEIEKIFYDNSKEASVENVNLKIKIRKILKLIIHLCRIEKKFKAMIAAIYTIQKLFVFSNSPFTAKRYKEDREENLLLDEKTGDENSLENYLKKSKITSLKRNRLNKIGKNIAEPLVKVELQNNLKHGDLIHDDNLNSISDTTSLIVIDVHLPTPSAFELYLIDEFFNFKEITIQKSGRIFVYWPNELMIFCDKFKGMINIK